MSELHLIKSAAATRVTSSRPNLRFAEGDKVAPLPYCAGFRVQGVGFVGFRVQGLGFSHSCGYEWDHVSVLVKSFDVSTLLFLC